MSKAETLKSHGVNIIQVLNKDQTIQNDTITFEGNDLECLRVLQIAQKEDMHPLRCYKEYSIIDGVMESPYGLITFH